MNTGRAEALASRFPPLLVAAERVAATVAQGVHGRRRVGLGDTFWQYRPFVAGDPASRIDWRQTGKSDRAYIRETEWEAAQTICLWRDAGPTMRWHSRLADTEKRERAELLLVALSALLLRGNERIRLAGVARAFTGRGALAAIAANLPATDAIIAPGTLPPHARAVLIGDFLQPIDQIGALLQHMAEIPLSCHLLQVLDPAECSFPYNGRIRFRGLAGEADAVIPRAERIRADYIQALHGHQDGLRRLCAAAGSTFATHHTGEPPEHALTSLYTALSPA